MIEPVAAHVPTFISSRSADVILSDIRPTKLTPDALNSINALLDELLYSILNAARSFNPSRLRTAMHKVLPTTLGKEAILEAEMELRAYYQRTVTAVGSSSSSDDGVFNLQWASELLRLKCEAYSTLSDTDENSDAENRLKEHMLAEAVLPPKQEVLSPASLYLTAIIESICEHILSNVGRVASRDSSRATANSQDLFIALCEDSTIYGFFKNMKVYGQIETLSKLPKPRRSKSFTREKLSGAASSASSREGDASRKDSPRHRMSSESSNIGPAMVVGSNHYSARSSIDKARAIKIFSGNSNRGSNDHPNGTDSVVGHGKTDSLVSANAKQSMHSGDRSPISPTFSEDRSQEFDDMMRSGSTMKVSLTPDRLRTMEALNKEKARFNGRKTSLQSSHKDSISSEVLLASTAPDQPKRTTRPSLRHVDSIHEDDEIQPIANPPPTSRPRQLSAATASGFSPPSSTRARSASSADPMALKPTTFPPPRPPHSSLGSSLKPNLTPSQVQQKRPRPVPHGLDVDQSRPPRTRTVARNRESLDLDDVMGGSDNEDEAEKIKSTPCYNPQRGLSASARELIDFLAEGPPEPPVTSPTSINSGTPKKTGRLQRMISKITLNGNEKVRSENEYGKSSPRGADIPIPLLPNKSLTNLSSLANRPVPPRYDLPSTTSSESRDSGDNALSDHRARKQSFSRKPVPPFDPKTTSPDSLVSTLAPGMVAVDVGSPVTPIPTCFAVPATSKRVFEHDSVSKCGSSDSSAIARVETATRSSSESKAPAVQAPERSSSRHVLSHLAKRPAQLSPAASSSSIPASVIDYAHEMRRTLSHATSATECRLLIDIFLARAGLVADSSELQVPVAPESTTKESQMEHAIVELLLGGDAESSDPPVQSEP
ncbi:hypothetical protein BDR04DRAFT_1094463 [Suillus decipiens]|nr:hypothetical protein BDR04DRAFT_1094463 [Suillus decipiens]